MKFSAIITELTKLNQTEFHPYGTGGDAGTAPIIATGEMGGNHCEIFPVLDNVFGFTNQQKFSALQSDVRSIILFRDRLLLQNSNLQQLQVTELFNQYGY